MWLCLLEEEEVHLRCRWQIIGKFQKPHGLALEDESECCVDGKEDKLMLRRQQPEATQ